MHPDYLKASVGWQVMRDTCEGEDAVKAGGEAYLYRPKDMPEEEFKNIYVDHAEFPGVMGHTVRALVGRVFFNEPTVTGLEEEELNNLDSQGLSWPEFLRWIVREQMKVGRCALLVGGDAQEPEIARYTAESLVDWEHDKKGRLEFARLMEVCTVFTEDGDRKFVNQRRNLALVDGAYTLTVQREAMDEKGNVKEGEWEIVEGPITPTINGMPLDYIPLVVVGGFDAPLYDLAKTALRFYKVSAGYGHSMYLAAHPTRYVKISTEMLSGMTAAIADTNDARKDVKDFYQFATSYINILPENGEIGYEEITGNGLKLIESRLDKLRADMASLGARAISSVNNSNIAADTERMQQTAEISFLGEFSARLSWALTDALGMVADLRGAGRDDYSVDFSREFLGEKVSPEEVSYMLNLWRAGVITVGMLREWLRARGVIGDNWTDEAIEAALEDETADLLGMDFDAAAA